MAKITVTEQDLTNSVETSVIDNIVYVPGYAIKGPINEPTLCNTLQEFESLFGSMPYRFKADQTVGATKVAYKDDFEKSYLYASELLRNGLPVLFERLASSTLAKAEKVIKFTNMQYEASFEDDIISWVVTGVPTVSNTITWEAKKDDKVVEAEITLSEDRSQITISSKELSDTKTVSIAKESLNVDNATNSIKIKAKYAGGYGQDIKVGMSYYGMELEDKLYKLTVQYNNSQTTHIVSLDFESSRFIGSISDSVIDVELISNEVSTLNADFIKLDLFEVNSPINNLSGTFTADEITITEIYTKLKDATDSSIYSRLTDKLLYNVKFITSGAYDSVISSSDLAIAKNILKCAANRGDAVGLIDPNIDLNAKDLQSYVDGNKLYTLSETAEDSRKYGAIFYPHGRFNIYKTNSTAWMGGSFAYLKSLAQAQKNNPNWFAVAGVSRGLVPDLLEVKEEITTALSDEWQSRTDVSINPILRVKPFGYTIWGNRTLFPNIDGLTASSFLNIRVMVSDIKKQIVQVASKLTFEINDRILWTDFKSALSPILDKMVSGRGLSDYKIVRVDTTKKATVEGLVRLVPIEAVEDFVIGISLEDSIAVLS